MSVRIIEGDCRTVLASLPDGSVNCCVTSPPYFGLRDYGHEGQMGLEATPAEFVSGMVEVFREVRRVLRDDGTLWLNLGDSYNAQPGQRKATAKPVSGLKPKDLTGIPWMLAFALRADGWYLRQDIIWHKPNPMPESVTDRCTKSHEYVFLLSKSSRYHYDAGAISEESADPLGTAKRYEQPFWEAGKHQAGGYSASGAKHTAGMKEFSGKRNKRSVWSIATQPYSEAHFATMAPELAETCIKAGCPAGGTVLDPFGGAGTTGLVADRLQRNAILIELNPAYADMARNRLSGDAGMFAEVA